MYEVLRDIGLAVVLSSLRNAALHYLDHLGAPGLDGRIILRWIFRKCNVGAWIGSMWLRIGTDGMHL